MRVPDVCECRLLGTTPSPWHCICGRWKPSAAELCEVCCEATMANLNELRRRTSLTDKQMDAVRASAADGITMYKLSRAYHVSESTIFTIIHARRNVA